jgi:methyl-accepting chemotaxis protein
VISIAVIVLVLDMSIFIVLAFTLQTMLLRPINKLLVLTNGIAAGNFDQTIQIRQRDGKTLTTLVPSIRKTTNLVQEISAASREQSAGAEQINKAIQQLDQVTQQNSTIAEETATVAEELANQVRQLQHTIAFFTIEESSQKQAPQDGHDVIAPRPEAPNPIKMPSERGWSEEETVIIPPAESPDDNGDEYDAEFERY